MCRHPRAVEPVLSLHWVRQVPPAPEPVLIQEQEDCSYERSRWVVDHTECGTRATHEQYAELVVCLQTPCGRS